MQKLPADGRAGKAKDSFKEMHSGRTGRDGPPTNGLKAARAISERTPEPQRAVQPCFPDAGLRLWIPCFLFLIRLVVEYLRGLPLGLVNARSSRSQSVRDNRGSWGNMTRIPPRP